MAHLDRQRAMRLMQAGRLDALLLLTPESFSYATGAPAGVATMWRRSGAVATIVPADPAIGCAAVVTDLFEAAFRTSSTIDDIRVHPIWVETGDIDGLDSTVATTEDVIREAWRKQGRVPGFARPETFDARTGFRLAGELLAARGLARGRIGVELDSLSVTDFQLLSTALPDAEIVDASNLVQRLKMIKSPQEIDFLQTAGGACRSRHREPARRHQDWCQPRRSCSRMEIRRRCAGHATRHPQFHRQLGICVGRRENPWTKGGVVSAVGAHQGRCRLPDRRLYIRYRQNIRRWRALSPAGRTVRCAPAGLRGRPCPSEAREPVAGCASCRKPSHRERRLSRLHARPISAMGWAPASEARNGRSSRATPISPSSPAWSSPSRHPGMSMAPAA